MKFHYIQFNCVSLILNKLKNRFSNIQHYILKETNITHLGQLNALAEVQGLISIQIEADGNPIIAKNWKMYSVFRLVHWGLKLINGIEVSTEFLGLFLFTSYIEVISFGITQITAEKMYSFL